ncbi:serine/threonine-protein kinase [Pontiellaceae bacterium B12227]|nr:serine/threonine-protein kinase [Pontiellaceae bacterium B12227]
MKPPFKPYKPKGRLKGAYAEATLLNDEGLQALCPSYTELAESSVRFQDSVLLGKGAVKEVYKTFNNHTQRWVAMARLRADRGPEFYDLFVHEAWLTASLNHPNIITIHDAGIDEESRPFFTMDLKGNSNLADRVKGPKSDRRELLQIFIKVCDAVAYAHSRGIIHLDLKPDNIQADEFGEVLVCDWGLAKQIGETEEGEDEMPPALRPIDNMTLVGEIKGSLGFMAPEQVMPGSVKDRRTDVFALGCMLYLIMTGQSPFTGSPEKVLEATRKGEVMPPRKQYPEQHIPEALEAVIMKATAKLPDDRYDSAEALRDEIFNFLGGYSTVAEKPGFFREARLFLARNRLPVAIVLCSVVALSVISVLFIQDLKRQQRETALQRERAAQERERATEFEAQAETVSILYQDELDRSENEREKLARKLATSASDLKKLGIFIKPAETVREARKLVDSAFSLDPDCASARLQRFSLDCITLDFKTALTHPVTPDSNVADYLLFAEAFSPYNFSDERRPTILQLTTFLEHALRINPSRAALMERIIAYDHAIRSDKNDYVSVVESLLQYANDQSDELFLEYETESSLLTLVYEQRSRLVVTTEWGSNESLLRFFSFRSFKPVGKGRFYLKDLHNLQIETLDLRACNTLVINETLDLPLLRTIYIRKGQLNEERVRKAIRANEPFEIIVE